MCDAVVSVLDKVLYNTYMIRSGVEGFAWEFANA